ncbi:MAG: hypothetical protein HQ478_09510 [Chloroflexi bacterium]|nr:hypothetical protein [Chloroflexota bacterium]
MLNLKTWIPVLIAFFALVAIACGAVATEAAPAADSGSGDAANTQQASDANDAAGSSVTAAQRNSAVESAPETASGGLDEACVQRVLGRAATGFAGVSAAERDAIFAQCSGTQEEQLNRQFAGGRGADFLENIDAACLAEITGSEDLNLADLSLEDRQRVFTECAPEGLARGPGRPGGGFGGAFAGLGDLLGGCVTEALGETPENLFGLEPEQLAAITEACGDQLPEGFGDFQALGPDGAGGFGGRGGDGGGFFGGGPRGGTDGAPPAGGRGAFGGGGFDLTSPCVEEAVGHPVTGRGDLGPDDFQKIQAACF